MRRMRRYQPLVFLVIILMITIGSQMALAAKPVRTDLDFAGAELRDVFRALAAQFKVDIFVSEEVQGKVTLHLSRVTLQEALNILEKNYRLDIKNANNVYRVDRFYDEYCSIQYKEGLVSLDVRDKPLAVLLEQIRNQCQVNLVFPENKKRVTLTLYQVPLINALDTIADLGGYALDQDGTIYKLRPANDTAGTKMVIRFQNERLSMDIQNAPLTAVAKEITKRTAVSVIPENNLQANITVFFNDLPVAEGLRAIAAANGLRLTEESAVLYRFARGNGGGIRVKYQNNLLSVDASNTEITQILDEIARIAKVNIVCDQDVRGPVTIHFDNLPLNTGLYNLLEANNFNLETQDKLYLVHKKNIQQGIRITYDPETLRFTIEISNNSTLANVLAQLAQKSGVNLVVYANVNAPLNNIYLRGVTLEEALDLLLRGTSFVYKKQGETILIGDGANLRIDNDLLENRIFFLSYVQAENVLNSLPPNFPRQYFIVLKEQNALSVSGTPDFLSHVDTYLKALDQPKNQSRTEVVRIQNMKAEELLKLFPASIPKTDLMVVKEGNALAVTGTEAFINRVKSYIAQVDILNPMILFDVMVIQIDNDDNRSGGLMSIVKAEPGDRDYGKFDIANGLVGNILIPGSQAARRFNFLLKASIDKNKAKVWANPQITAMNGSAANFKVLTKDQLALPYESGVGEDKRTLYNIVDIETGIQISLTPWVSANNDITLEIKPHISQSIPSTTSTSGDAATTAISSTDERSVETFVRVRDNETIIIGGLRQKIKSLETTKVPILGDIPLLGKLFRYNTKQEQDSEFIIVITPRLVNSTEAAKKAMENSVANYSVTIQEETPFGKDETPVAETDPNASKVQSNIKKKDRY